MLRKPNSIPKTDTVITDPAMEPFFITKSTGGGGFTVFERVIKGENNTPYIKTICYPSSFNRALAVVAKEMLGTHTKKEYTTVKEYIQEWESIENRINNIVGF